MTPYSRLKKIFKRYSELKYLQRILHWDESVMMPIGAGQSRAHAMATLTRTMQKILVNNKVKLLLEQAKQDLSLSTWDQANLAWMEKKYQSMTCLPLSLVEQSAKANMICEQMWRTLRPQNNWAELLPHLEKVFHLTQEMAERRADLLQISPYDTCLDEYADGFTQSKIDPIFATLQNTLPNLIKKIRLKQEKQQMIPVNGPFPIDQQKQLGLSMMLALGFDFQHGRLDISHHPFCSGGADDVRITTRYETDEFLSSLYAICHETGHALYEQGLPRKWITQPVGQIHSMAQHESQSLLMEMDVCRAPAFCDFLIIHLNQVFGKQPAFTAENIFHLLTHVKPDFIRVDADEVTYPLHVILRYELEKKLFNKEITIKDLPFYWNEKMISYLHLNTLGNDKNGVMQDVHWVSGTFGYFPAYTLGRLMAAQLFASFSHTTANYIQEFKSGHFQSLKNWLQKNVYDHASSLSTHDLLLKITGEDLNPSYFIQHIEKRYL